MLVKIRALSIAAILVLGLSNNSYAEEIGLKKNQYPNISGEVLVQVEVDHAISKVKDSNSGDHVNATGGVLQAQPKFALNFNKNWSVSTKWDYYPVNMMGAYRDSAYPERNRTILSSNNRQFNPTDNGLAVTELRANFQNEDLAVSIGKFTAPFATAYRKSKRIGVFTTYFTEDYNLTEKLGGTITALLENTQINFSTFANDTTPLNRSVIHSRPVPKRNDGIAGNTSSLSSYAVSVEGGNLFGYDNWFYNVGYRSLGVSGGAGDSARENGYTAETEYQFNIGERTSIIPLIEVAKFSNFYGIKNRDATYITAALIGNYKSWSASISQITRDDQSAINLNKTRDRINQFAIGYKITNNFTVDVARADIKEDGKEAPLLGVLLSYLYKF